MILEEILGKGKKKEQSMERLCPLEKIKECLNVQKNMLFFYSIIKEVNNYAYYS